MVPEKSLKIAPVSQVYAVYFKTNRNLIREMPNVKDYVREIYQLPGKPQPFAFSRAHAEALAPGTHETAVKSPKWLRLGANAACLSSA